MAITIARPVTILDHDTCVSYRLPTGTAARDANGDYAHYVKVLDGVAINHHATPNFDEKLGNVPVILKNQNVMTSDKVTCEISLDFRAEDVIKITQRVTGAVFWMTIVGEPTVRPITSHQTFYCTPTMAPKIT